MVSTNDIRGIAPDARSCYFEDEMDLAFYEKYTLINCQLECAIFDVEKKLDCIPWHLPRVIKISKRIFSRFVVNFRDPIQQHATLGQPVILRLR